MHGKCVAVDSGLEWTQGEVIVNSSIGPIPCTMFFFGFGLGSLCSIDSFLQTHDEQSPEKVSGRMVSKVINKIWLIFSIYKPNIIGFFSSLSFKSELNLFLLFLGRSLLQVNFELYWQKLLAGK
jgi:hypothetical protein